MLGGQVTIPSHHERRRARRRSSGRKRSQRLLRALVILAVLVVVVVAAGYGYFRYEWSQVASAPCSACAAAANGDPYNVLLIGSDTRSGEPAGAAQHFGTAAQQSGQHSDTIKIVHVDPKAGTASTLSIPRDTFVTLSGMPASSPYSSQNKINTAYEYGPNALIQTIQNTFGIPISHYIVIDFFGVQDAVNALGGISMNFPYPVRDWDCSSYPCNNNSGLSIPNSGCQTLNGAQALALSRSRYFQYYKDGEWISDPTGDLGRIQRQNLIISAVVNKAKSTYNPLRLNTLLTSLVHDFTKDDGLTPETSTRWPSATTPSRGRTSRPTPSPPMAPPPVRSVTWRSSIPNRRPPSSASSSAGPGATSRRPPSIPTATTST